MWLLYYWLVEDSSPASHYLWILPFAVIPGIVSVNGQDLLLHTHGEILWFHLPCRSKLQLLIDWMASQHLQNRGRLFFHPKRKALESGGFTDTNVDSLDFAAPTWNGRCLAVVLPPGITSVTQRERNTLFFLLHSCTLCKAKYLNELWCFPVPDATYSQFTNALVCGTKHQGIVWMHEWFICLFNTHISHFSIWSSKQLAI